MKKFLMITSLLFVFLITGCQTSTSQTTVENTTTTELKTEIDVTFNYLNFDLNDYFVQTYKTTPGVEIVNQSNFSIAKNDDLFTSTPLQRELIEYVNQINNMLQNLQAISNDILNHVIYYEDLSYDHLEMTSITDIQADLILNESDVLVNNMKFKVETDHVIFDDYSLNHSPLLVEWSLNSGQLSMQMEQGDHELFTLELDIITRSITATLKIQDYITLDVDNVSADYQIIRLERSNQDLNETIYFYGDKSYGAIYNEWNKGNDKVIDYEVHRSNVGLVYKSMSSIISGVAHSVNGYTLNSIENWRTYSTSQDASSIELRSGNYVIEDILNYLEVESKFYPIHSGISIINANHHLYSDDPYYMVGYFIKMDHQVDHLHTLDISTLSESSLGFYSSYIANIKSVTSELFDIIDQESNLTLKLHKGIAEYNDSGNTVAIMENNDSIEVLLLDSERELVDRYPVHGNVYYQDGYLFIYGETNSPYVTIKEIKNNQLVTVHEYQFDFLSTSVITDLDYDSNTERLIVQFNEGESSIYHQMIVNLSTNESNIVYNRVLATFNDALTQTRVDVVITDEDVLLLLMYNSLGELTQVTTGVTPSALHVVLDHYKIQENQLMLYGKNGDKPYLFIPKFTSEHRLDVLNTIDFTYYLAGNITQINYLTSENVYLVDLTLDDQTTLTIKVNTEGEISGALIKLGYVTDWSSWSPEDEKFAKLTHINYSFAGLGDQKGTVVENFSRANQIAKLKQNQPHLKVILSIGGWGANYFSEAASNDENRKQFAKTSIAIMQKYNMDGIDLDWEYPGCTGCGITYSSNDKTNFTLLLKQIREDLNILEVQTGRKYELTIAAGAFMSNGSNTELTEIIKYLDFINVMTYDMERSGYTSHHTNLFTTSRVPGQYGAATYIERFIRNGVPAQKLNIGIAFYGRGGKGITSSTDGLYRPIPSGNRLTYTYTRIKNELLSNSSFVKYWDNEAKSHYVFNGDIFISYDDPQSIEAKVSYVKDTNLLGVFFWEFSQDGTGDLINAIDEYSR